MNAPDWALTELGWTAERYLRLRSLPDSAAAARDLAELKETATATYRRRARELHPDCPENGQAETEKLIALNAAIDVIRKIEIRERPRPEVRPVGRWYTTTTSEFSTTASGGHSYWQAIGVMFVRT